MSILNIPSSSSAASFNPVSASPSNEITNKTTKATVAMLVERYIVPDGLGDLMFAIRTVEVLKSKLPSDIEVCLYPISRYEEESLNSLHEIPSYEKLDTLFQKAASKRPLLILHGPITSKEVPIKESETVKILNMSEYSCRRGKDIAGEQIAVGPGKGELGIYCDEFLYKNMCQPETEGVDTDRLKIALLKDTALQELLFGNPESKIYFGYSSNGCKVLEFTLDTITSQREKKENLDICIVHRETSFFDRLSRNIFNLSYLQEKGISSLEIWKPGNSSNYEKTLTLENKDVDGKTVRIFLPKRLNHDDFINMLIASQPHVLVTGDQSLTEAISAGKIIWYDVPGHKGMLNRNLIRLAETLENPLAAQFLKEGEKSSELKNNPLLKDSFRELSHLIYKDHNLGVNLAERTIKEIDRMTQSSIGI